MPAWLYVSGLQISEKLPGFFNINHEFEKLLLLKGNITQIDLKTLFLDPIIRDDHKLQ